MLPNKRSATHNSKLSEKKFQLLFNFLSKKNYRKNTFQITQIQLEIFVSFNSNETFCWDRISYHVKNLSTFHVSFYAIIRKLIEIKLHCSIFFEKKEKNTALVQIFIWQKTHKEKTMEKTRNFFLSAPLLHIEICYYFIYFEMKL